MRRGSAAALAVGLALSVPGPARAQDTTAGTTPTTTAPLAARPADPAPTVSDPTVPGPEPADPAPGSGAGIVDGARSGGDPLAGNGLGGAFCRSDRLSGGLSGAAADNCRTTGVSSAPAPVTHYGFDIHIDLGRFGLSGRTFAAAVQVLILVPLWTLLLYVVRGVFAVLEWSYAFDLLDPATAGTIATALRSARDVFTEPLLVAALAVAAGLLAYHGLVRRALAESVGGAVALLVMIVIGLGVIADPAGTVGETNTLVQDASLGTVAALGAQDPARAAASLADALRGINDMVIEGPWCYMEFGDVAWCRDPARLDDRLRRAATKLAGPDRPGLRCGPPICPNGDDRDRAAAQLSRAQSNGDLFLAFPANGDERNSINDEDSLFRALCGADSDDDCTGPTAEQARWRTEDGTWPRAGGLVLIAVGVAGMIALLGFLALRLLGSAIMLVLCLLLAPVAVLAPAFGEGGRAVFRAWGARLLGALAAKLLYSALLGVVLLAVRVLEGMGTVGWWTQWLLVAAFWWIVFAHRHRLLEHATLDRDRVRSAAGRPISTTARVLGAQRLAGVARPATAPVTRTAYRAYGEGRKRLRDRREHQRAARAEAARAAARGARGDQAERLRAQAARNRAERGQRAPHAEARLDHLAAQRERVAGGIRAAQAAGDRRSVLRLRHRDRRIADQVDAERLDGDALAPTGPASLLQPHGDASARHAWLDHQTTLRRGVVPGPRADAGAYRDYPRLAPLVGTTARGYRALAPGAQRRVRLEVDRALRARADATRTLQRLQPRDRPPRPEPGSPPGGPPGRESTDELRRPRRSARERQFGPFLDDDDRRRWPDDDW